MTPNDKRLIEVALPLEQVSLDSVHEKNVRYGHISTLHILPARRPLAACRAAQIATLLPDSGDRETRNVILERMAGLAGTGSVEMSGKEWANACIHPDEYWLYVAFDCASHRPRLVRVQDPFTKLLVRGRESIAHTITAGEVLKAAV